MAVKNPDQKPESSDRTKSQTHKKDGESNPASPPFGSPPNPPIATECQNDSYHEKNYRLNRRQFVVATITLIVLSIYTAIAAYQACKMRDSTIAATKSADTAAKQLEMTERAWMNMDIGTTSPITVDKHGLSLQIGVRLKNTGNSPATGLRLKTIIIPSPMGHDAPSETIKERDGVCNDIRTEVANGNDSEGETVFPNSESVPRYITTVIPRPDLDGALKKIGSVTPMIVNCAAYRFTFNKSVHTTAKVILIMARDPKTGSGMVIIPPKEGMILAPERFFAAPSFVAAVYAD